MISIIPIARRNRGIRPSPLPSLQTPSVSSHRPKMLSWPHDRQPPDRHPEERGKWTLYCLMREVKRDD